MANSVRIEMQREFPAIIHKGEILEAEQSDCFDIYVCVDELKTWIGNCTDIKSLEEIVSEDNLIESIKSAASGYEQECIMPALKCNNYKYDFFGKTKTAIKGV